MKPPFYLIISIIVWVNVQFFAGSLLAVDYYVDSRTGNNGDSGADAGHAWRDFTNLNGRSLTPGDNVFLACGSLWDQELKLSGSGTVTSPITLTSYGSGSRPRISRKAALTDRTITLIDPSHWIISNLELSHANMGLEIDYTGFGNRDVTIDNLYIHNIDLNIDGLPSGPGAVFYSAGILISFRPELANPSEFALASLREMIAAKPPTIRIPSPLEFTLTGLTISNCEIARTTAPIVLGTSFVVGNYSPYSFRDVLIRDNDIHDARGPINTAFVTNGLWLNNIVTRIATSPLIQGTTGIFVSNSKHLRFVNNWISHLPDTASGDQSAIDFEAFNDEPEVCGNFISDTAGVALEFLFIDDGIFQSGEPGHTTNVRVEGNVFKRNTQSRGTNDFGPVILGAAGGRTGDPYNQSGAIANNLIIEQKAGYHFLGGPGSWERFAVSNNLDVGPGYLTNAAVDFDMQGGNEWSYQVYKSGQWSSLVLNETGLAWGKTDGQVTRFNLIAPSEKDSRVARLWTAPSDGVISIRGYVVNVGVAQSEGLEVVITRNGSPIWPASGIPRSFPANEHSGYDANLDGIQVSAHDLIRFEVHNIAGKNPSDHVSWIPTIAYLSPSDHRRK